MCEKEVAETLADIHGQAISAINERERRLAEEHVKLTQLKEDLAKAHSAVGTEASQKVQIIAEAETPSKGSGLRLSTKRSTPCKSKAP